MATRDLFAIRIAPIGLTRAAAAIVAALSWTSFLWTFYDYSWGLTNLELGLVSTSLYYSHAANLFIAVYFSGVALGRADWANPKHYGHVLIIISILFAHYWIFKGSEGFWTSPLRSKFLHGALGPVLFAFYFLVLPKGKMEWKNAAAWTIFPLVYTFYGMTRGILTGKFPYAISNVDKHGFPLVLTLIATTTLAAWLTGMTIIALDKALAKGLAERAFLRGDRSSAS